MAVGANAITTLVKATRAIGLDERDKRFHKPGLDLYYDDNAGAGTGATVEVRDAELDLVVTGDAGSDDTLDTTAAANDTIGELATVVTGTGSWVANALTHSDALSVDLVETAAQGAQGHANRKTLKIIANRDLELIVDAVTEEIESYLKRGIKERSYTQILQFPAGTDVKEFHLREPDVTKLTRFAVGELRALDVEYTGTDPRAWVEVTDTGLLLRNQSGASATESELLFATFATVDALVTEINTNVTDWSATKHADAPSSFLVREGSLVATGKRNLYAWEDFDGEYIVDYDAGTITVDPRSLWWPFSLREWAPTARRILIAYDAGYATIPADVEQVAHQMIASEWNRRGKDDTLQSETIGPYSYTTKQLMGDQGREWKRRLETYMAFTP